MESKQFESAESKQANSSPVSDPLPGSASIGTSSLNSNSNVLNNNSGTTGGGYSSDDGGFMSGEEDFETASEKPVLPDPDDESAVKGVIGEDSGDHFVGSSEFPMPIDNELADDDAEKGSKVGVLGGEVEGKGVAGGEGSDGKPETVVDTVSGEYLNSNSDEPVKESVFVGTPEGGFDKDKVIEFSQLSEGLSSVVKDSSVPEGEVEEVKLKDKEGLENRKIEALDGENAVDGLEAKVVNELVEEHAVESDNTHQVSAEIAEAADGVKVTSEGDSVAEAVHVELPSSGVAVVGEVEEKEAADGSARSIEESDQANPETVEEIAVQDSSSDPVSANVVVTAESELVEADGVKFTPEGDSVVEDIHVDLAGHGVAVVGEMEKNEEADGSVKSHNESEQVNAEIVEENAFQNSNIDHVNADIVEVTDSELIAVDGANFTPGGDSVVEDIHVDLSGPGVAVVGKVEENGEADGFVEHIQENEKKPETQVVGEVDNEAKQNGSAVENSGDGVEVISTRDLVGTDGFDIVNGAKDPTISNPANEEQLEKTDGAYVSAQDDILENVIFGKSIVQESDEPSSIQNQELIMEVEDEMKIDNEEASDGEGSVSDGETDGLIFGSSEAAKQFIEELERGSGGGSHSGAERIDGQIVTDSDEEVETDEEEGEGKELFDSAALAALLKAATGAGSDGGNITITSQDGSRLFSVERPAGLGSSVQSLRPAPRANRSSFLTPSGSASGGETENLSEEEKGKLEKLQSIRVKFLRLVQRLGLSPDESVAAQVLYRLALVAGRQTGQLFGLDAAKRTALQLEEDGKEDLDFSLNILILGKSGVGKSATINAIFGEEKARIDAFQPATATVKEITGMVDGVKIRVFDTPGLKSSVMEQSFNRSVLSSVKKFTKKSPLDIVLYVDRLDAQTRDLNDLPLLRTVTSSLGPSIWRSAIVTLTHAASAPPDGPSGSPLSYDVFVTQRSHVLQQSIGQAVGDLRMMSPSLMNPVSLVENHPSCRKNREGQKVLPNGQTWRPQLMLLCYSMKILSEANSLSKPQDPFDHRKLFGFRSRSPPLPYMLSSMLQSRAHPKLSSEQGGDNGDSDIDLADLSDSDQEEDEDEYDQLPPFKPLRKSQLAKLSKEQRKAYFEEYDYRVKLLQKKQWREELKRMREMKKKGKDGTNDYGYTEEDPDSGSAAPVSVPLPDMALPPSFDGDNPAHRYRFLEPTSQFLARPVLDTHGWDHDCGYDGVNLEQSLAIASQFPAVVSVQLTKDKKEFSINLDSSIAAKHGENGSSMAGFDIQAIGKQLAYIIRGETKFKNLRKNKTAAGISVTFLGENVVTGLKVEDQITIGKQYSLVGSAGTVRSQQDAAYGANIEVQRRELDYPIGQVQSSFGLSIIKWRGDLALGFNSLAQFSIGRSSKVAVRAGINNKLSGQITVRTSSSEHLSLALASVIPTAISIYKKLYPGVGEKYSIY